MALVFSNIFQESARRQILVRVFVCLGCSSRILLLCSPANRIFMIYARDFAKSQLDLRPKISILHDLRQTPRVRPLQFPRTHVILHNYRLLLLLLQRPEIFLERLR